MFGQTISLFLDSLCSTYLSILNPPPFPNTGTYFESSHNSSCCDMNLRGRKLDRHHFFGPSSAERNLFAILIFLCIHMWNQFLCRVCFSLNISQNINYLHPKTFTKLLKFKSSKSVNSFFISVFFNTLFHDQ